MPDVWNDLSSNELAGRLSDLGLVLCQADGVLVCVHCKYSLQPSGQTVSKHLWEKHSLPAKDRAGLNAFVRGLELHDPNALPPCPDGSPVHPHLAVQCGVTCLQCRYRTTSPTLLKRHMAKEHGQRKCRDGSDKDTLWAEVSLQSWSQQGKRDFWIVKTIREDEPSLVVQSPRRKRRLSQIRKEEVERLARRQQSMDAGDREDPLLSSNWMRRTGWNKLFSGTDRSVLVALSRPPMAGSDGFSVGGQHADEMMFSTADERRLAVVSIAIDRFLDRCEDTLRHSDHSIRCCLRSHFPGRSYKSPFELPSRNSTRTRYRSLWKRMVFFCIRIHLLGENIREDVLHLPFPNDLQLKTERLWSQLTDTTNDQFPTHGSLPSQQSNSFPSAVRHSGIRGKGARQPTSKRYGVNNGLSAASSQGETVEIINDSGCVEDSDGDEADSDEEYVPFSTSASDDEAEADEDDAISVASIRTDDGTDRIQSALRIALCEAPEKRAADPAGRNEVDDRLLDGMAQFCVFLCTEPYHDGKSASTVMVYFAGVLGISPDGTTVERPSNYTPKLSALVHIARLCLLEATLPRFSYPRLGWDARPCLGQQNSLNKVREAFLCQGNAAPVGELLSLRAYGRTMSRTDGPTFRVEWSHDGSSVQWDDGELSMADFRGVGHQATNLVRDCIQGFFGTGLPSLDLNVLHDRMSEHKNGYSFVHDSKNGLAHGYLEFSEKVCADPVHSLMTRNGWNERAVRRFLKKEEKLLEYIMVMMYLRGGQAPRVTEFFSMLCWNGASSSRGLYVHGGSMLYITRHSKARKTTNQEFQVARYLPAKDSVALATYLVYIRLLADMIQRSCFGTNKDRKYLFSSVDDTDNHWKPSRLTVVLRSLTKEVAGIEIGVQVYRQLSIAVTERHLAHISKPFNRFDDKTIDANVDVALAWQSGHRPMQRGTSYGIDAAYPDSLQPALLRVYRWTSDIWHRFLDETQDTNADRAMSPTATDRNRAERPRRRQRTNHAMPYLVTPAVSHTSIQTTPVDVDMAAPMAHDDIEQRSVRSNTQCSDGVGGCELSEEIIPGDRTIVSASTMSMPNQSRVRSSGYIGEAPPSTPMTRPRASCGEQTPTHRLSDSSKKTFARDQEVRAAASLTDVDVFWQFEYLEDYKLLVCKFHGYAIRNVKRHLE